LTPITLEIFKYEWIINEWVNHNTRKYKYVGEKGKEYEVIQSIFYEINQLPRAVQSTNPMVFDYYIFDTEFL